MLTAPRRLLLVHAHPDDESISTGGTIARAVAAGAHVTVVTCTLGEQGEVIPEELRGLAADAADQLGGYRIGELRGACTALGVDDLRFLGGPGRWRDSGMVVAPGGRAQPPAELHPRAFVAGEPEEQARQLAAVLQEVRPQVVITYGPDGGYGHPDHVRAHRITMAASAAVPDVVRVCWTVRPRSALAHGLTELAALGPDEGPPFPIPAAADLPAVADEEAHVAVDVRQYRQEKLAALRAHPSQLRVWQGEDGVAAFALTNGVAQPLLDTEFFTVAGGSSPDAGRFGDPFEGVFGGGER